MTRTGKDDAASVDGRPISIVDKCTKNIADNTPRRGRARPLITDWRG